MTGSTDPRDRLLAILVPADDHEFREAFTDSLKERPGFVGEPDDEDARTAVLDGLARRGYPNATITPKEPMTMDDFFDTRRHIVVHRDGA